MFARALFAFLALPGIVAYAVPATWMWRTNQLAIAHAWGLLPFVLGTAGLLWCVRDFYSRGKGTLAPWSPPQHLVVVGLYRYSRNPMYVCVLLTLVGWAVTFASTGLALYALVVTIAFQIRVVHGEEPWLARTHGAAWQDYVSRVSRWFG